MRVTYSVDRPRFTNSGDSTALNTATLLQRNRLLGYTIKGEPVNGAMGAKKERMHSRKTC